MSIIPVLEVIGEGIEGLRNENEALKRELNSLRETCDFAFSRLRDMERQRDELNTKLQNVQAYADSLAATCEKASMNEKTEEGGC